ADECRRSRTCTGSLDQTTSGGAIVTARRLEPDAARPLCSPAPSPTVRQMDLPRWGVFAFLDTLPARETIELARTVETLGYGVLWTVEAVGRDAYAHAGHLLGATDRLVVGSGVASIWTRTAAQAIAAARTHAEASGGRFVLGLGVNNPM